MKKYKIIPRHKVSRVEKIIWFIIKILIEIPFGLDSGFYDAKMYLEEIPDNPGKKVNASFMLSFLILFFWFLDYFPKPGKKFKPRPSVFH